MRIYIPILLLLLSNSLFAETSSAVSELKGLGNEITGTVSFTKAVPTGVDVKIDISGVTPGEHGFHIHQFGDCSALDGTSAGGHFSVGDHQHSHREAASRHVGDLGNLLADKDGNIKVTFNDPQIELNGEKSIVGRGLILHADADDFKTQPTGNSGARIACGVIGIKN